MNEQERKLKELEDDVSEYAASNPTKFKLMMEGGFFDKDDFEGIHHQIMLKRLAEEVVRQLEMRFKNRSPLYKVQKLKNWELILLFMAYEALNKPLPKEYEPFRDRIRRKRKNA